MSENRAYIAGAGLVCPLGSDPDSFCRNLLAGRSGIAPLGLFALQQGDPLPVGEIRDLQPAADLPRTHGLALEAATQALAGETDPPDALVLGTTTGGILTTEELLAQGDEKKEKYRYHGLNTVSRVLVERLQIKGPVLTVSTACSSGAVALALALELLRSGRAKRVLTGGVDSLCRLTYFGFHSLQLVDRNGCRPMDIHRRGMTVAEGAAMLLLTAKRPDQPLAALLGAGLSCDAHHPAAPHPQGRGALGAMRAALADSGLSPDLIDYLNLHGTGTLENDLAESRAVRCCFPKPPPLSSIKGAIGHSLAAAGAIEAVLAALALRDGFMPANTGLQTPDPETGLAPLQAVNRAPVQAVLSNSFGFGGNNGSLVLTRADRFTARSPRAGRSALAVYDCACLTGAGRLEATLAALAAGEPVAGIAADQLVAENLPVRTIRRLKRLARMALCLADDTMAAPDLPPLSSVYMGSGWGAQSETYDFLTRLTESNEQFPSPTDFVGSVHNGAAGQVAIAHEATGANITTSGGDFSFEQALLSAELMLAHGRQALVMAADEAHPQFTPLLDASENRRKPPADGGGCLRVGRGGKDPICNVNLAWYAPAAAGETTRAMVEALQGRESLGSGCGLVLAGLPAGRHAMAEKQLQDFMERSGLEVPVIRFRELVGEFASASAVAAVLAVAMFKFRSNFFHLPGHAPTLPAPHQSILVLGLGESMSVMEFTRP